MDGSLSAGSLSAGSVSAGSVTEPFPSSPRKRPFLRICV